MRALGLLQSWLEGGECIGHARRRAALVKAVGSLLAGSRLSVTMLGRGLATAAEEKHRIKSVDELLSNARLHAERVAVYRRLAHTVLRGVHRVLIEVDWSDSGRREVRVLRAAVALGGRSLVLYEQVYSEREYNRASTHGAFLRTLAQRVLPAGLEVTVVTDAGFRAPWFRAVESLGWQWLGRVRNNTKYQSLGQSTWCSVRDLHARAGNRARALGTVRLNKGGALCAQLFLAPAPRPKRRGPRRHAEHYRAARSHREPLVLAASPRLRCTARQALAWYAKRMQIEQSFRDLKNPRHGFGLRYSLSTRPPRVAILLLIGALATLLQWLAGLTAERAGWSRLFQANTERRRRVLSTVFLGARMLRSRRRPPTNRMLSQALDELPKLVPTGPAYT